MTEVFHRALDLPVSAEDAFAWHERPGAIDRLIPPWERVEVMERADGLETGSQVRLRQRMGPLRLKWIAEHHDYEPPCSFSDRQISGPFASWDHLHEFRSDAQDKDEMVDHIEYRVPGGGLGSLLGKKYIRRRIERMFEYRHTTTSDDLQAHAKHQERGSMTIAISGATGLVGTTLAPLLTTGGHEVTKLVRGNAVEGDVSWDPNAQSFNASPLDGTNAVVHLAGENIAGKRWSQKVKDRIRSSRVDGTRVLCEGLAKMSSPPEVLVCASATGFYGDRGDDLLSEESAPGDGFLAEVCEQWEAATQPARDAGIRVVNVRFGVVLSPRGGALAKMLLPFKLGMGGPVGNGRQYWSWISIDDAAGAIHHAIMTPSLNGPVNLVSPNPVTNREFTKTLGRVLKRPTIIPIPAFGARLALGEMVNELLLPSARVEPKRLLESGYEFRQPDLEGALRHVLGK